MRIVLFSGTSEGRQLSRDLALLGADVIVCVATEYGHEEQGTAPGITVHTGRMEMSEMVALLQQPQTLCIDTTHPYATAVTNNIRAACAASKVPYKRLLRPVSPLPADCRLVDTTADAVKVLQGIEGNILLTTGAKELAAFASLNPNRLYARVLPLASSLTACEKAGIPPHNILAMQGPFSKELNLALIHQFSIKALVTKDGGAPGGFDEKLQAARAAAILPLVIRRPIDSGESYDAVLSYCKEWIASCR